MATAPISTVNIKVTFVAPPDQEGGGALALLTTGGKALTDKQWALAQEAVGAVLREQTRSRTAGR